MPLRRLALFRLLIVGFALYDMAASGYVTRMAGADPIFYQPIFAVRVLRLPQPTAELAATVRIVVIVALVFALVGLVSRLALAVAAPLYLWWWSIDSSYGKINHGHIVPVVALVLVSIAPSGRAYSIDALRARSRRVRAGDPLPAPSNESHPLAGWALRSVMLLVVVAYLGAAYAKLDNGGLGWVTHGPLRSALIEKSTPLGLDVAKHPWLVELLSGAALALEASAWLLFVRGRARNLWCVAGATFHVVSLVLLDVNFLGQVVAYAAFYDLEVGAARAGALTTRLTGRVRPLLHRSTSSRRAGEPLETPVDSEIAPGRLPTA